MGCAASVLGIRDTAILIREAEERRSRQHISENVVCEEFIRDVEEFYDLSESSILGTGASGEVKVAIHRDTGLRYAIKRLKKNRDVEDPVLQRCRLEQRIMVRYEFYHNIPIYTAP